MRVVTVAYLALAPEMPQPRAGTDAAEARWVAAADVLDGDVLAFDHQRILADGVERARAKLEYTPLAAAFCPPEFTIAQLRRVYEIVWGTTLDPRNFHRKVTGTPGFVIPAGTATAGAGPAGPALPDRARPAALPAAAAVLRPATRRVRTCQYLPHAKSCRLVEGRSRTNRARMRLGQSSRADARPQAAKPVPSGLVGHGGGGKRPAGAAVARVDRPVRAAGVVVRWLAGSQAGGRPQAAPHTG